MAVASGDFQVVANGAAPLPARLIGRFSTISLVRADGGYATASPARRPRVLIADEPTGQLDSETAQSIMQLIRAVVRDQGVTAVVATHDPLVIRHADRVVELSDGEPASGDHSC